MSATTIAQINKHKYNTSQSITNYGVPDGCFKKKLPPTPEQESTELNRTQLLFSVKTLYPIHVGIRSQVAQYSSDGE